MVESTGVVQGFYLVLFLEGSPFVVNHLMKNPIDLSPVR